MQGLGGGLPKAEKQLSLHKLVCVRHLARLLTPGPHDSGGMGIRARPGALWATGHPEQGKEPGELVLERSLNRKKGVLVVVVVFTQLF